MIANAGEYQWRVFGDVVVNDDEETIFDVSNLAFIRSKDSANTVYQVVTKIAAGSFREVYEIHSLSTGKFKAIKLSFSDNSNSFKEFRIIGSLNFHGRQTGICKPDKMFFMLPSGVNIQVMPKYHESLLEHLVGRIGLNEDITDKLKNNPIPDQRIIQMLKQIVSGLMYLRERSVYHGDIDLRNILCSWSVPIRFDLMDFEYGVDFSEIKTTEELFSRLDEHNRDHCIQLCLDQPALSDQQLVELCKNWLHAQDVLSFGMMLENYFVNLIKNEFNLALLHEIITQIKETPSLEGILFKILQMQNQTDSLSEIQYYAKSKYENLYQ